MTSRTHPVLEALASTPSIHTLRDRLPAPGRWLAVGEAPGSSGPAVAAHLHGTFPTRFLVWVASNPGSASAAEVDISMLLGEERVAFYPQRQVLPYEEAGGDLPVQGLQVEALEKAFGGGVRVLVTTARAVQERIPLPASLSHLRLTLRLGETHGFVQLQEELEDRGFQRVPLVEEVGQFAVRGGILDIFSLGTPDPVRLEFWGDEISSIRAFDILDQRSNRELDRADILPVHLGAGGEFRSTHLEPRSLLELLPHDTLLLTSAGVDLPEEFQRQWGLVQRLRAERLEEGEAPDPEDTLVLPPAQAKALLEAFPGVRFHDEPGWDLDLGVAPAPTVDRDMDRLKALLREGAATGVRTLILCENDGQLQRMEEILTEQGSVLPTGLQLGVGSLEGGFCLPSSPPLHLLTDHEIFRRARRSRRTRRFRGAVSLDSLAQLTPGEYVVHMEHGVGRFRGLERVEVAGEAIEAMAVEYAGGEVLRIPVYRLDLVERWVGDGEEGEPPSVHRIGGKRWKKLRRKTEDAIQKMTAELLELYARRESAQGYAFGPDTPWQQEMEASFLHDDTPDQRKATADVKRDMESERPMDRLVCGDVGFGKTEVAIRAAFKAVQDGKQVAFLAPTTILAEQHRHTLEARLADYPVRVGALSRFRSAREQRELLLNVAEGTVDVVVGTHRLLSSDVLFKDLGLVIVDEEQRFGVRHKERLKKLRATVDVLTLSATPIPRTLNLAMTGLRDLSLIQTPPRSRLPISTLVVPWNDGLLQEAIWRELDRGGQVFFLHNRVESIRALAERVERLVPEASVGVAHGQMPPGELDEVMSAFTDGELDVLVCSSIIENGLDVPNANTLIVDRADRFGLSQLYQIRGRVGRSDRKAYCYLVVPNPVSEEADRRLRVLEHYTELGSGYAVAMKDLEIRGAGNILGEDQSGYAHQVGMDTYLRLLEKTVARLKNSQEGRLTFPDPEVSLAGSAYLPDGYVSDSSQKLHLYRRLSRVETQEEVDRLREEMMDRYGPLPPEVERLLQAHRLRLAGRQMGVERIFIKEREGRLSFRPDSPVRLAGLEGPFHNRQLEVGVKRMDPLALVVHQMGAEPLPETLVRALHAMNNGKTQAVA
ncbi:MAG: transcription-repair coupling factor [Gemmatimonadota bacterium]